MHRKQNDAVAHANQNTWHAMQLTSSHGGCSSTINVDVHDGPQQKR